MQGASLQAWASGVSICPGHRHLHCNRHRHRHLHLHLHLWPHACGHWLMGNNSPVGCRNFESLPAASRLSIDDPFRPALSCWQASLLDCGQSGMQRQSKVRQQSYATSKPEIQFYSGEVDSQDSLGQFSRLGTSSMGWDCRHQLALGKRRLRGLQIAWKSGLRSTDNLKKNCTQSRVPRDLFRCRTSQTFLLMISDHINPANLWIITQCLSWDRLGRSFKISRWVSPT